MEEKKSQQGGEAIRENSPPSEIMDMETLLAQEGLGLGNIPERGDIRKGVITAITSNEILIDVQSKADGLIAGRELEGINSQTLTEFQVGEEILVYVLEPEDNNGHVVLSYTRAQEEQDWEKVESSLESGEAITTFVEGYNKGGLLVPVGQLRGFVPGSLVSVFREGDGGSPEDRWNEAIGKEITLKVIEVDRSRQRLILSERDAIGETREAIKDQLLDNLAVGDRVSGYVSSLADFGAFVNIQGVDGLVHLSELSWDHVDHPSDLVKVGQELEVEVISIDEDKRRIGLSMRRLLDNPWIEKAEEIQEGQLIQGTITNLTDFGAFARIENTDLEGLIHISELSLDRVGHPSEVVSVGETLALRVISLDMERHRIGLSLEKVDSDEFAAIDLEQIQEEMNEEGSLEDILSGADAGEELEEEPVSELSADEEPEEEAEEDADAVEPPADEESEEEAEEDADAVEPPADEEPEEESEEDADAVEPPADEEPGEEEDSPPPDEE
ncbi:MAG: S1 RNA-binding domain-containing protein [Anaerolineales bacterium]|nr:S1 RNA-binding domain-containing protein [Anaerolineales bacterium]